MNRPLIMTPGPTQIHPTVLEASAVNGTNPDLDYRFFDDYKETVDRYNQLIRSERGTSLILAGEAILGLEAACASLIEPGDKVLVIANGFFGAGFSDFVKLYGGEVILLEAPWDRAVSIEAVKAILAQHTNLKFATLVHCETPTGVVNPIHEICSLLKDHGILSIVDSVSAIGGELVEFDAYGVDVLLGGSQKCLSAPAGLTLVTLSEGAIECIKNRKTPIAGYYVNLKIYLNWYEKKAFPYTQPLQAILGLKQAIENALKEDFVKKHHRFGSAVRKTILEQGLSLFAASDYAQTVTAIQMPEGMRFEELFNHLKESHGILIGGCLGHLKGKVFRIGHMGENNHIENFLHLFRALDETFSHYNVKETSFEASFLQNVTG